MKRQQSIAHRLSTLNALYDTINAMRSVSASHLRQSRIALRDARLYREQVAYALAEIGFRQTHQTETNPGLLVLASDLGLCGDFNSRLVQLAVEYLRRYKLATVYAVGRRAQMLLTRNGISLARIYDAPASVDEVPHLLLRLSQDLLEDNAKGTIRSLRAVSARFDGVGHFTPKLVRIMPIQVEANGTTPLRPSPYVPRSHLFAVALREHLYITLHELLLDALASEHGMRLMAAEAALEWIDATREHAKRQLAAVRSEVATQELLDILQGRHIV